MSKSYTLVETGVFLLILDVLVAAHLWEAISGHWQVAGEGLLMNQAWIRQGQALSFSSLDFNLCYIFFLRFLFSFLGNHQSIVVTANILLQLFGLSLFYRGGRRLFNRIAGLILAGVMGIISIYDFSVNVDNSYHMIWFACGFLFWLISFLKPLYLAFRRAAHKKAEEKVLKAEPLAGEMKADTGQKAEKTSMAETPPKEEKQKVQFIPNPLPLPKKHVKKEMNYAFEPPNELMHYDLNNYSVDDDYDLKVAGFTKRAE